MTPNEISFDIRDMRWWTTYYELPGLERSEDEFRNVEWRHIRSENCCDYMGMETKIETKKKGSEQPPTKVGLDDKRTQQKKTQDAKDGITDRVMEHQSKDHEVQRV